MYCTVHINIVLTMKPKGVAYEEFAATVNEWVEFLAPGIDNVVGIWPEFFFEESTQGNANP